MTWSLVVATVAALLGTAIGAAGTIVSQQVYSKSSDARARFVRAAERRAELKDAVDAFMGVYQEMEGVATDGAERSVKLSHHMWYLHNRLELIARDDLVTPLNELANALNATYWHGPPDGTPAWEHLREPNARFRGAARAELAAFDRP